MATIKKLASGNWRAQVRRKGCYTADTFRRRKDAEEWALDSERCIDQGPAENGGTKARQKPSVI